MTIKFDSKNHLYLVNGEIATISVTELLRKHGLAPTYFNSNDEKKERGKKIHEDLECVCNSTRYVPKTEQGKRFKAWANENLSGAIAEQLLAIQLGDLIVAGTADIMAIGNNGDVIIADHKNMAHIDKTSVAWQVSLYDYFARALKGDTINGKNLAWQGANKFLCFQYTENGEMKTIELEKIDDLEIERLLWAEQNGETYTKPALVISSELAEKVEQAELMLANAQKSVEESKRVAEELRKQLIEKMKEQRIKSWETDTVKITYIEPTTKNTVDTKLLKALYPVQYASCVKTSAVKESVRITFKEKTNVPD